jgi:hypothetical protein
MKNTLITLIAVLFTGACATTPTMKSVAGTYERKDRDSDHNRRVFLDNGVSEFYVNDIKKRDDRWKITKDRELHIVFEDGHVAVFYINKNGSLTGIATIDGGKRKDEGSKYHYNYNRIK